jgi:hypothetical protein
MLQQRSKIPQQRSDKSQIKKIAHSTMMTLPVAIKKTPHATTKISTKTTKDPYAATYSHMLQ